MLDGTRQQEAQAQLTTEPHENPTTGEWEPETYPRKIPGFSSQPPATRSPERGTNTLLTEVSLTSTASSSSNLSLEIRNTSSVCSMRRMSLLVASWRGLLPSASLP